MASSSDLTAMVWIFAASTKIVYYKTDPRVTKQLLNLLIVVFDAICNTIIYSYITNHDGLFYAWFSFTLITTCSFKPLLEIRFSIPAVERNKNARMWQLINLSFCGLVLIQTILIMPLFIISYGAIAASIITILLSILSFCLTLILISYGEK
jgi:hypothetical protein